MCQIPGSSDNESYQRNLKSSISVDFDLVMSLDLPAWQCIFGDPHRVFGQLKCEPHAKSACEVETSVPAP